MFFGWKKVFLAFLVAGSVQAMPPAYNPFDDDDEESELAGCEDFLLAMGDHADLFRVLLGVSRTTVEDFWVSAPLRKHVPIERHKDDPWASTDLLVDYLNKAFSSYARKAALSTQRGKSLATAVRAHGFELPEKQSRKAFETQSRVNQSVLLEGRTYQPGQPGMAGAEKAVAALTPVFTHNAPRKVDVPASALVSSLQLEKMGFPGGLNTSAFNKWLRADDQVFFFVHTQRTDGKRVYSERNMALAYGDAVATLDPKEAKSAGWVSAYVMDPDDLLEFGLARFPDYTQKLRALIGSEFGVSPERKRVVEEGLEKRGITLANAWLALTRYEDIAEGFDFLRAQLHSLDFTVEDFTGLLHHQLLLELQTIRGTPQFDQHVDHLANGNPRQMAETLQALFYKPLRLPRDFELKVPVAVPPGALRTGD